MPKQTIPGNCFICGKNSTKIAMKNHVIKEHNDGEENCYLIKAEGAYNKDYWLFFTVPLQARLEVIDEFLRQIWCECCGHLSAFCIDRNEFAKSRQLSVLAVGDKLLYEYDFGSTTEIMLTIVSEISRPKQRQKVRLLARNEPLLHVCNTCGVPATHMGAPWDNKFFCDKCVKTVKNGEYLLPVVNSPRSGECGYDGERDKWTFDRQSFLV